MACPEEITGGKTLTNDQKTHTQSQSVNNNPEVRSWLAAHTVLSQNIQPTEITSLDLRKKNLNELPDWIGHLSSLKELNLQQNNLTELPESIGYLSGLTTLILDFNQLTVLPDSIGRLSALKTLSLNSNDLYVLP